MYSKVNALIRLDGSHFLTAGFFMLRTYKVTIHSKCALWLLCILRYLHIQGQMEATFRRQGSWCTEHIRLVKNQVTTGECCN